MIPIIESKRDQRVLDWLISQVGEEAVAEACRQLAGGRRKYVSNIAKALGLHPPAELALTSREDAKQHIEGIRKLLQSSQNGDNDNGAA